LTIEIQRSRTPAWLAAVGPIRRSLLCLAVVMLVFSAAVAPPAFSANSDPMMLNLKDADIRAFIESMSELTGKNFVIDPRVQGKVTVISALPTDPKTLYEVFVSILKVHGFTAVDTGDVVKIVPDVVAKTQGGEIPADTGGYLGEEPVTRVIPLQNVTAAEIVPVLQPLLPPEAHIAAHNASNAIVISDSRSNVARIAQIISRIDRKVERDVEIIRLNQANAEELARILNATRPQTPDPATGAVPIGVVADERTNSVIIGGDRATRLQLRTLISHLDTPMNVESGVEVIYLRNAVAKDIVETLKGIGSKLDAHAVAASSANPAGNAQPQAAAGASASGEARKLDIFADEATNSIIMQGSPERIKEMKSIIQALDIRRAQVHVAGIIAEVSQTKAAELGIQWRTDTPNSGGIGGIIFPGTAAGNIQSITPSAATLGAGLTLGFLQSSTVRALLRALANDSATNILSTPTLVTMDNEEAEITVGQNVPFITGQFTSTGTGQGVTNPFQTIERKDVGVLLKVKPQINEGDTVKLTIQQEVSSVANATTGVDLITNKRAIKTNVLVEDGQIIVIGGLISDDVEQTTQKVPLLGDIPLIGNAFRNRRSDVTKTNLMVFLQPTIIRDTLTANTLTLGKYNFIREKEVADPWNRAQLLPQVPTPRLPEFPMPAIKDGELPPPVQNYRRDEILNSPSFKSAPTTPPNPQGHQLYPNGAAPTGSNTPPPTPVSPAAKAAIDSLSSTDMPNIDSPARTFAASDVVVSPAVEMKAISPAAAAEAAVGIDGNTALELQRLPSTAPVAESTQQQPNLPGFMRDALR
jgi:general secretion pathway protein D